jgi:predicted cupin superfamily sugar epimerase
MHKSFDIVPTNTWFASEPAPGTKFSLVGCTVAPGFDFSDFEVADAGKLASSYPGNDEIIHRLCR